MGHRLEKCQLKFAPMGRSPPQNPHPTLVLAQQLTLRKGGVWGGEASPESVFSPPCGAQPARRGKDGFWGGFASPNPTFA